MLSNLSTLAGDPPTPVQKIVNRRSADSFLVDCARQPDSTSVSMTLFWRPFMEQQARAENAALRSATNFGILDPPHSDLCIHFCILCSV